MALRSAILLNLTQPAYHALPCTAMHHHSGQAEELRAALSASEDIRLELSGRLAQAEDGVAGRLALLNNQVEYCPLSGMMSGAKARIQVSYDQLFHGSQACACPNRHATCAVTFDTMWPEKCAVSAADGGVSSPRTMWLRMVRPSPEAGMNSCMAVHKTANLPAGKVGIVAL